MKTIKDYLGRRVTYTYPPKRIISFAPAITDTLYSLGATNEVVGRTRFCIHPQGKIEKAINVGGTKDLKMDRVHSLQADLIIAEKEENTKEMVEQLEKDYPVYVFKVQTIDDALQMINDLGQLIERHNAATQLQKQIINAFQSIPSAKTPKRVAYMIWQNPYMVVGNNTYIQSMLDKLGFINPFTEYEGRYPTITIADLQNAQLDYLFLATEPFPFQEKHKNEFSRLIPHADIQIVDGEMFWYGVKMLDAAEYFKQAFANK